MYVIGLFIVIFYIGLTYSHYWLFIVFDTFVFIYSTFCSYLRSYPLVLFLFHKDPHAFYLDPPTYSTISLILTASPEDLQPQCRTPEDLQPYEGIFSF